MFQIIFFSSVAILSGFIIIKVIRPMYLAARDLKEIDEEQEMLNKIYESDFD